jgi:hypothetical protein
MWIFAWALCNATLDAQPVMQTILTNGPASNRLNIVLLSEGYTTNQLPQFLMDATNAVNTLLSHSPYSEYRAYFNAFAISVASAQSGSDHPSYPQYRNTPFNSTYDLTDVRITIPTNSTGQGKIDALLKAFMPRCHLPILLVNDVARGGSDGFDKTAIVSSSAIAIENSLGQPYILSHETGHVLANLGDEYTNSYPGFPNTEEPNTTRETRRDFIKWKAWISNSTPIPTPVTDSLDIGLFQGAHYHVTNWYRPKLNCAMGAIGIPFCEVCSEALTVAIYKRVRPVDSIVPAVTNFQVTPNQPLSFSVSLLQPNTHDLSVQWYTNGVALTGETNTVLNLDAGWLPIGSNLVRAVVKDLTSLVRNDPSNRLNQAVTWGVTVNQFMAAKGVYNGLFGQTNRAQERSGFFTLTVGEHGGYTARLKRGTNSYSWSGFFDNTGQAGKSIAVGTSSWTVTLVLDLVSGQTLSGTISMPSGTADLLAYRTDWDANTNPATQFKGKYTVVLPGNDDASASPGGDGFGTLSVGPAGYVTLSGFLADGNAMSQSVQLSAAGDWAMYVPLYGGAGSVWSWLQFDTNNPALTIGGNLNWIRPARSGAVYYPAGFTNDVAAVGSRYTAPTNSNTRVIDLTNGIVRFRGGNLSAPFTNIVTLTSSNRVINGSANSLSMSVTASNGLFSGSVKVPGTTRTNTFEGVVLQDARAGYGYFLGTNQSGEVTFDSQ